ncbi:short-chain oxidoreductase [Colletotrichum cuscutae]|uniref:Short-chain oxidoreductase n=1 Tax=Colletotrichum cuscutae TaxID=1209917 RepID=A0AAI9XJ34_9PEZI|nr:short-chain oxidoreductase [Colletotrichum cuscutae]
MYYFQTQRSSRPFNGKRSKLMSRYLSSLQVESNITWMVNEINDCCVDGISAICLSGLRVLRNGERHLIWLTLCIIAGILSLHNANAINSVKPHFGGIFTMNLIRPRIRIYNRNTSVLILTLASRRFLAKPRRLNALAKSPGLSFAFPRTAWMTRLNPPSFFLNFCYVLSIQNSTEGQIVSRWLRGYSVAAKMTIYYVVKNAEVDFVRLQKGDLASGQTSALSSHDDFVRLALYVCNAPCFRFCPVRAKAECSLDSKSLRLSLSSNIPQLPVSSSDSTVIMRINRFTLAPLGSLQEAPQASAPRDKPAFVKLVRLRVRQANLRQPQHLWRSFHFFIASSSLKIYWNKVFQAHVFGPVGVARAFLPHFRARKSGMFIFMGSTAAWEGIPTLGAYCASESALRGIFPEDLLTNIPWNQTLLVEPSFFRTELLNVNNTFKGVHQQEPGDPAKGVSRIIDTVESRGSAQGRALHISLALGTDAVSQLTKKFLLILYYKINTHSEICNVDELRSFVDKESRNLSEFFTFWTAHVFANIAWFAICTKMLVSKRLTERLGIKDTVSKTNPSR